MTDIRAALESIGISGREAGNEYIAACPMHRVRTGKDDGNPSWSINLKTGAHNCFSCGYKGNLITLSQDLDLHLEDLRTLSWVDEEGHAQQVDLPDLTRVITLGSYLDESVLARFDVPPKWAMTERCIDTQSCEDYQVLWDITTESWILPVREAREGHLMGWQQKGQTTRVFLNYPTGMRKSRTLFGFTAFRGGRMIVVESPLDAVRIRAVGIEGAVAAMGAVVSRHQLHLMSAADEVIFAMDNPFTDAAGRKAVERLLQDTKGILHSVRFFDYSGICVKDPGEMTPDQIYAGIEGAKSRVHGMAVLA